MPKDFFCFSLRIVIVGRYVELCHESSKAPDLFFRIHQYPLTFLHCHYRLPHECASIAYSVQIEQQSLLGLYEIMIRFVDVSANKFPLYLRLPSMMRTRAWLEKIGLPTIGKDES